jgi:hypothetical protein
MWWTLLVVAGLTAGLFGFCTGQIELPNQGNEPLEGAVTHDAMLDWTTSQFDFAANPDPAVEGSGLLATAYGGNGATFGGAGPHQTFEIVSFEFWEGSPAGWVEYVDKSSLVDCYTGAPVPLPGDAFLKVHFEGATRKDDFIPNPIGDGKEILDATQICDKGGILEWAIGVVSLNAFRVESYQASEGDLEYSVVDIEVMN